MTTPHDAQRAAFETREPTRAERVVRDHHDRIASWTPDHGIDPGDSHDKGESFCVGEAA